MRARGVLTEETFAPTFSRLFEMEVDELEGIAVMTDSDNCGQSARAWYGEIAFHPE